MHQTIEKLNLSFSASNIKKGFVMGLGATVLMTAVMFVGVRTGVSPLPKPVPVAVVGKALSTIGLSSSVPKAGIMLTGLLLHFAYGGLLGGLVYGLYPDTSPLGYFGVGVTAWILMGLVSLPFLGWGFFGVSVTPKVGGATLVGHLVYGAGLAVGAALESGRLHGKK